MGKDGILKQMRDEASERIESSASIYRRLARAANGEAILNAGLVDVFEKLLLEGNTRDNCARVCGITRRTVGRWISRGQADIEAERASVEAAFTFMVDRCEGAQERTLVIAAFTAATRDTSDGGLALKILERRNPDDWAPALPDQGDASARYAGLSKAALREEAKRVLQAASSAEGPTVVVQASGPGTGSGQST